MISLRWSALVCVQDITRWGCVQKKSREGIEKKNLGVWGDCCIFVVSNKMDLS